MNANVGRRAACFVLAIGPAWLARDAGAQAPPEQRLLVVLRATSANDVRAALLACGARDLREIPAIGVYALSGDEATAARLLSLPAVEGVARMGPLVEACGSEPLPAIAASDPLSFLQWNLVAIRAPAAWAAGHRGRGVRVAVLDTGCDPSHPDLAANVNGSLATSFVPGQTWDVRNDPVPAPDHGTRMAGVIAAAENSFGITGVAPEAEIVPVQVLQRPSGTGPPEALLEGIVYAADIGAQVINMSLTYTRVRRGGVLGSTPREVALLATAFARATEYAHARGCTLVAAAGNGAIDRDRDLDAIVLPADAPHVLSIAATGPLGWAIDPETSLDEPAVYTNYGLSSIDLSAPGGNQRSGLPETCAIGPVVLPCFLFDFVPTTEALEILPPYGPFNYGSGTSISAAHVSAVAALVIGSRGGALHPQHVAAALRSSAEDLGTPGRDAYHGHGRVDAGRAVR